MYPVAARIETFIEYHSRDGVWANESIITYTALMLKTNYITFSNLAGTWNLNAHENDLNRIWFDKMDLIIYQVEIPPTIGKDIYIHHVNGNHFEAACLGVAENHRRA